MQRGPYKKYLQITKTGLQSSIPRTTTWNRQQAYNNEAYNNDEGVPGTSSDDYLNNAPIWQSNETEIASVVTESSEESATEESIPDVRLSADYSAELLNADTSIRENESYANVENDSDSSNEIEMGLNDEMMENVNEHMDPSSDLPLYDGSYVTVGIAVLLIQAFAINNGLTLNAIQDLLKLLKLLLPPSLKLDSSLYLFKKQFSHCSSDVNFHLYCPNCLSYLGILDTAECKTCNKHYLKQNLIEKGSYFIGLDLIKQIKNICTKDILKLIKKHKEMSALGNSIKDILDEKRSQRDKNTITLTFNCDGVPVFKSSTYSIWPIQASVNELPPKLRARNILLLSIWFGYAKPCMRTFLSFFVKQIEEVNQSLSDIKIAVTLCSCDTIARCMLQNFSQFNGENGCSWCLNEGKVVEKGRGNMRAYVYEPNAELRTSEQTVRFAKEAVICNLPIYGVKGPSYLMQLSGFDIISGFTPDRLHCIDLGVVRQFLNIWLNSSYHNEEWYIGTRIQEIDEKLAHFYPPNEISRLPRSLKQRAYWKGSELRNWLLYYSLIALKSILPDKYLNHWMLLVGSIYALSTDNITPSDLEQADIALTKFVIQVQVLYGLQFLSYNVHQLVHLVMAVKRWGPLWAFSSDPFESNNGVLLKLFHGTQAVPQQIATKFLIWRYVVNEGKELLSQSNGDAICNYFSKLVLGYYPRKSIQCIENGVFHFGAGINRNMTIEEEYVVSKILNVFSSQILVYSKLIFNGSTYCSMLYNQNTKRDNCYASLQNNVCVQIQRFLLVSSNEQSNHQTTLAVVKKVHFRTRNFMPIDRHSALAANHIRIIEDIDPNITAVKLNDLSGKFILFDNIINNHPNKCLIKLSNLYEIS